MQMQRSAARFCLFAWASALPQNRKASPSSRGHAFRADAPVCLGISLTLKPLRAFTGRCAGLDLPFPRWHCRNCSTKPLAGTLPFASPRKAPRACPGSLPEPSYATPDSPLGFRGDDFHSTKFLAGRRPRGFEFLLGHQLYGKTARASPSARGHAFAG